MSRRVAVTGLGIVSCLGHDYSVVVESLKNGRSGVRAMPDWTRYGLKSRVAGAIEDLEPKKQAAKLSKKLTPGMSDAALFCSLAAKDAMADAGLTERELEDLRTGCIVGSGVGSVDSVRRAAELYILRADPARRPLHRAALHVELDERLGLLSGKLEAAPDSPGGGEVDDRGKDLPTASLRSWRLRRRACGACGYLSRYRRRDTRAGRLRRPFYETAAVSGSGLRVFRLHERCGAFGRSKRIQWLSRPRLNSHYGFRVRSRCPCHFNNSFAALDGQNLRRALEFVLWRAPTLLVVAHP